MHYLDAEYESGYHHIEDYQDHSPYVRNKNIFDDILHKRPERAHGKLVRLSLVGPKYTHSIDWTTLPENARPIRLKFMEADLEEHGQGETRLTGLHFGYQYNDENGKNVKEVKEIF